MFQFVATFEIWKTLTSKLGITTFKYKTVVLCQRFFSPDEQYTYLAVSLFK